MQIPDHWQAKESSLYRQFIFNDFIEAFSFMQKVAFLAEKANHHPNWQNVWNKVDIHLNTHDAGNTITEKDIALANAINALASKD